MTATTFKFFKPNGDCRRVTFDSVPEFAAINEVVDGLVEHDTRDLVYTDSEGDRIVIKSSRDVAEAVRDARDAHSKTVKIWIRCRRKVGAGACGGGGAKANCRGTNNYQQRPRCGRRLFGHPGWVHYDLFNDDVTDILGAFFPRLFINYPHCRAQTDDNEEEPTSPHNDNAPKNNDPKEESSNNKNSMSVADEDPSVIPASEERQGSKVQEEELVENTTDASKTQQNEDDLQEMGFELVENTVPESDISSKSEQSEDELKSKMSMLREMGFDLPDDVAKNMISELGGRMDLIVRALVANNK